MKSILDIWYDSKKRNLLFQITFLAILIFILANIANNTIDSLKRQKIASGFFFLNQEAGFEISESVIDFSSASSYGKALLVGALNTLKVAFIGNILALGIGFIIAISRLSKNWLLSRLSLAYIEIVRNIPLLLQLFFWYALFSEVFPSVRKALNPMSGFFLSNRGVNFPWFSSPGDTYLIVGISIFSFLLSFFVYFIKRKNKTRLNFYSLCFYLCMPLFLVISSFFILGGSELFTFPELKGFNFKGGGSLSPEFLTLILGLVIYTSAFNAEIIRSGILSVKKGQWEAASALGLNRVESLRFIIIPQSMRLAIPPLTSQFLNLTKNSSLAVAIAYPDFVSIANTTLNQTGQAIELVSLIMILYLSLSLLTSLFMNYFNKKMALVER